MQQLSEKSFRFFDIAANLSDNSFQGEYFGKKHHQEDIDEVLKRANLKGVDRFLFAAGYIEDSLKSYELSLKSPNYYCTVGVHPCRAAEVEKDSTQEQYFQELDQLIQKFGTEKCIAVGECGLDYDRLEYATQEVQLKQFPPHFDLAQKHKLPMYLHSRNTGGDFTRIVKENRDKFSTGVVHSFTGTLQELKEYLDLNLYIGINGCSLKTQDNLDVVKQIPLDRMMLETDCPYCDIRPTHASYKYVDTKFENQKKKERFQLGCMIKGRNEPCTIIQVLEVVSKLLNKDEDEVAEVCYQNTLRMFNIKE